MRVAMVCPQLGLRGGTERQAALLAEAMAGRGHEVTLIAMDIPEALDPSSVPVVRLSRWPWVRGLRRVGLLAFTCRSLVWLLRHRNLYDVVHFHRFSVVTAVPAWFLRSRGVPVVLKVSSSGTNADYRRWTKGRLGTPFRTHGTAVIATSSAAEADLREDLPAGVVYRIPNGVVTPEAVDRSDHARCVVIAVGSLREVKGHHQLIEAWPKVAMACPDADVVILGEGPLRRLLQTCATRVIGRSGWSMPGEVPEVASWLASSDVFVLPSHAEGMSNALLEACAAGLPCVVTDVGSNREVLGPDNSECVVADGDVDRLAEVLSMLCAQPDVRITMGRRLRDRAISVYGIDAVCDRYETVYGEVVCAHEQA